jgi:MFS family permease
MSRPNRERPPHALALFIIVTCQLMVTLDSTVVNVALLPIRHALGFSPAGLDWVIDAYSLTFGGFLLLGSRVGDVLGRRPSLCVGIALFTVGSLAGGMAPSPGLLLASRAIQGLGAAFAAPNALALITVIAVEGRERTRALGLFTAASAAGGSLGLVLGGALTSWISWRAAFFVNVPVGLLVLALVPRHLPSTPRSVRGLDVTGALLGTMGLVAVINGLIDLARQASATATLVSLVSGATLLVALTIVELRVDNPIVPPSLVRNRRRLVALVVMLLVPITLYGTFFLTAQYVEASLHFSPLKAGLSFLPLSGAIVAASRLTPGLVARRGPVASLLLGVATVVAGSAWMATAGSSSSYLMGLLGPLLLLGAGAGLAFPSLNAIALAGATLSESGATAGLLQAMQQIGTSAGVALLTVFALADGRRAALVAGCAFVIATFALAAIGLARGSARRTTVFENTGPTAATPLMPSRPGGIAALATAEVGGRALESIR